MQSEPRLNVISFPVFLLFYLQFKVFIYLLLIFFIYINNSIKYVKDEKEYLYRALKEIQVLKVLKPSVNFIMFKLLIDLDLKDELIKRKILIRSCSNYIGLNENFYRIAVRTSEENKIIINEIRNILFDK